MTCKLCGKPIPANEAAAYGNRCEECWCLPPNWKPLGSAAGCYTRARVMESVNEVTNQLRTDR